ncbi:MAG: M28 family peptidase [Gemmatimonadota bacterium]
MSSVVRGLLPAIALLALSRPLIAQDDPRPVPQEIRRIQAAARATFSGDNAMETVAFVERYFRVPGNTGFNASITQVAGILDHAGFVVEGRARPTDRLVYRIEHRPMTHPTWEPESASVFVKGSATPLEVFATNRNMMTINSFSTPVGGVEAEVVYVGAGRPEDWQGKDVRGKIVFGETGIGRLFHDAVVTRGAAGVLAYAMPAYTKPEINRTSIQFSAIPYDSTHASWGILLTYDARTALKQALVAGPVRLKVQTFSRIYQAEELTLVAEIRGAVIPGERFVFSAHVQEPGANDNASGVGTLAEVARSMAAMMRAGDLNPARTVTFIWGDEIRATERFLQENPVRTQGVRWGLSLDMVGENTQLTGGTFLIEKMPDPSAVWTRGEDHHTEWGGSPLKVEDLRPHYYNDFVLNRALDQAAGTGWVVRTNPYEGGSDHTPFLDARKPGLLLWHFTDQFYHTDNDRLDKVSAQTMTNVGVVSTVVAATLASADSAIALLVVNETERAALARLAVEFDLSRKAIADGGKLEQEVEIIQTWTEWYDGAIQLARDLEVGGPSSATENAIQVAVKAVDNAGLNYLARLSR